LLKNCVEKDQREKLLLLIQQIKANIFLENFLFPKKENPSDGKTEQAATFN
jgi:hypothetical protein